MLTIGIIGLKEHSWKSINRTKGFYLKALTSKYNCIPIESEEDIEKLPQLDALLHFSGNLGWILRKHPNVPLIFAIHGGAILNQHFLLQH